MRSRAPLALMEQLVMVLVFALAAALCLRAFALADALSRQQETRDRALLACQQAAEELKLAAAAGQEVPGQTLYFDENWLALPSPEGAAYVLTAARQRAPVPGLGRAEVSVCPAEGGEVLASLPVAWQEVAHG